jgi:hypothetical protein
MKVERFHIDTGPAALFQRVQQVFDAPRRLKLHGSHLAERAAERAAAIADIEHFYPQLWELVLVEARTDTGKFVSTTWRRSVGDREWWVVIGFHDTVRTIYAASSGKRGLGPGVVTDGELWQRVALVNQRLVEQHDSAGPR